VNVLVIQQLERSAGWNGLNDWNDLNGLPLHMSVSAATIGNGWNCWNRPRARERRGSGRKPDSEINHELLGADICNGLKRKKIRMSSFLPLKANSGFDPI
jgi:hypothetical protein